MGTLLFQLCTGRQVPIFLGSSFAFIAPIIYATQTWGLPGTMFGLFAAGFMYFVFAALVGWRGIEAVHRLLPPVVIGPVIMIIGLSVATVASNMAMGRAGGNQVMDYQQSLWLAAVSLSATVLVAVFARGMFRLVPILAGVIAGYVLAADYRADVGAIGAGAHLGPHHRVRQCHAWCWSAGIPGASAHMENQGPSRHHQPRRR